MLNGQINVLRTLTVLAVVVLGGSPNRSRAESASSYDLWAPDPNASWQVVWWPVTWLRGYGARAMKTGPDTFAVYHYRGRGEFALSPDNKRVAISLMANGLSSMRVDGRTVSEYDEIIRGWVLFSPDSKKLAFAARNYRSQFVVENGEEGPSFAQVSGLAYSPDSRHFAYAAFDGKLWSVIRDGKRGLRYSNLHSPIICYPDGMLVREECYEFDPWKDHALHFSPNGKRLAYKALIGHTDWAMIVDDAPIQPFGSPGGEPIHFTFSPDSRRTAYARFASEAGRATWAVVLDGKTGPVFERGGPPRFSPDSKRLAYAARKYGRWFLVVDGEADGPWEHFISSPSFAYSSDGKHIAYIGKRNGKATVMLDRKVEAELDDATQVWFADGSTRPSYVGRIGSKWTVFVQGQTCAEYNDPYGKSEAVFGVGQGTVETRLSGAGDGPLPVVFSWDCKRSVVVVRSSSSSPLAPSVNKEKHGSLYVVIDGKEGPELNWIDPGSIRYSADSKHLLYAGEQRMGSRHLMVDNEPGPPYSDLVDPRPVFAPDNTVRYLTRVGDRIELVQHSPPKPVEQIGGGRER